MPLHGVIVRKVRFKKFRALRCDIFPLLFRLSLEKRHPGETSDKNYNPLVLRCQEKIRFFIG